MDRQRLMTAAASRVQREIDAVEAELRRRGVGRDWRAAVRDGANEIATRLARALRREIAAVAEAAPGRATDPATARWIERHADALARRISVRVARDMSRRVAADAMRQVAAVVRAGQSAAEAAQRMRDVAGYTPAVRIARSVLEAERRAVAAARGRADAADAIRAVHDVRRYAQRVLRRLDGASGYGMRGETLASAAALQRAVATANEEAVRAAVRWHAYHKAAYHARMTARTEIARAATESMVDSAEQMGVERVRFVLNRTRHTPDECDDAAVGSSPGERPGVYRLDDPARPQPPLHPNCMCYYDYAE